MGRCIQTKVQTWLILTVKLKPILSHVYCQTEALFWAKFIARLKPQPGPCLLPDWNPSWAMFTPRLKPSPRQCLLPNWCPILSNFYCQTDDKKQILILNDPPTHAHTHTRWYVIKSTTKHSLYYFLFYFNNNVQLKCYKN